MRIVKVVSFNDAKSQAYNLANENFFVPNRFRTQITENDSVIVKEREFTSKTDDAGNIVPCDPWKRTDVVFVGSYKDCVIAKNEDRINEGIEDAIVAQEKQARVAALSLNATELSATI